MRSTMLPGLLSPVFDASDRYRRPILTIALVLAMVMAVGRRLSLLLDLILLVATFLTCMLAWLLALLAVRRSRPATLLVRPEVRAFATAPSVLQVYTAVGLTLSASLLLGNARLAGMGLFLFMVLSSLFLVTLALQVVAAWSGSTVQLRPDGVYQRDVAGSLTVPWEALAPGRPIRPALWASALALTYARPELVRQRGIVPSRRLLRIDSVHAWFIADAIRHYVDHPQHRAAIGEPAEYQRLWHALTSSPTAPDHGPAF